jgi:hypothetical protein
LTSKPYSKYEYQAIRKGLKIEERKAFLKAINRVSNHLYSLNPLRKRNYCFLCLKKSNKEPQKEKKLTNILFKLMFQLNSNLIEILQEKEPKYEQFRGKQTK